MDSYLLKSLLPDSQLLAHLTQTVSTGIDHIIYWPIVQSVFLTLYCVSAEHSRSIHLKSEGCFGEGFGGKHTETLDALCDAGSADLFTQLGVDLETYGNAFLQVVRDGRNQILGLSYLPAITMFRHVNLTDFVQIVYLPDGQEKITHFSKDEVLHLRYPCPAGGFYALPSWIAVGSMLELVQAAVTWNEKFFTNHSLPEYAIVTKGAPLNDDQKQVAKDFFQREYKGSDNSHRTLVLHISDPDASIEFKELTQKPKDGDFLKLLDAAKERIHIAHGVPPRMLGIISAGSLAGGGELTAQLFSFEKLLLSPKRRRIRDQLRPVFRDLGIAPRDIWFKGIDLTPPDVDNQNISEWVSQGIISSDEARTLLQVDEREGLSKQDTDALYRLLKRL
ncbi:MAG TPA: phage portal protein [Thiotrichaceae bacterium]|nr:phage portal protein [Thiotrichaceae bacterium]